MARVLVSVPNLGWIHRTVVTALANIMSEERHVKTLIPDQFDPPYDNALNMLAEIFYNGPYDFWLNLDADTAPKRNPLELVDLDKDFIGLPVPMFRDGQDELFFYAVFDIVDGKHKRHLPTEGLQKVDAVSSAGFLMSQRVFDRPQSHYQRYAMREFPFLSVYNNKGQRILGPDLAFCGRARANGIEIYAHFDYSCKHTKEIDVGVLVGKL